MQWFRFAKHGSKPIEELFITDNWKTIPYGSWSNFQLSVKGIRGWIGFALLCLQLVQKTRAKTKTSHDLVARILLWLFRCFFEVLSAPKRYFPFWLVVVITLVSDLQHSVEKRFI